MAAAHYASHLVPGSSELLRALRSSSHVQQEAWNRLDFNKTRNTSNQKYLARRGGHHRIPLEMRNAVLGGNVSLQGIAERIARGECRRIVALVGAGASTASGIPDFRSPSGLWSQEATRQLLSQEGFMAKPDAFWRKACDLFLNRTQTKV